MPYVILAAAFALLAQLAAYGFATAPEGVALAACDQLAKGADFFSQDWGAASICALMLKPLYLAAFALNGGDDGIFYLMRIIVLGIDFALALVAYRILSRSVDATKALWTSLLFLACATVLSRLGDPFGLATACAFASLLCAWETYLDALADDGEATGYLRVFKPLLCGVFAISALAFSTVAGMLVIVVFATALVVALRARGASLLSTAWVACGAFLAIAVYLIIAMGYGDPGAVFAAIGRGLAAGLAPSSGLAIAGVVVGFLGVGVFAASYLADALAAAAKLELALRIAGTVLAVAACCISLCLTMLPAMQGGEHIGSGPAQELNVSAEEAAVNRDALDISDKVSDSQSVFIAGDDAQWAYLLLPGKRDDAAAQWVLLTADADENVAELDLANCGQIAANESFQLCKRASAIGSISQA